MDTHSLPYLIALIVLFVISLVGLMNIKSMYEDPSRLPVTPPAWWPYSKKSWLVWAKATPISPVYMLIMIFGAVIVEYGDPSSSAIRVLGFASFFLFIFGFLLSLLIAFTGHPKWLIPKHLR